MVMTADIREFEIAVEDVEAEEAREAKIAALVAEGKTREEAESEVDDGKPVPFKIAGRTLHAYPPHDGQMAFLLASLGRGQTSDTRFAAIVNIMLETLRGDDKDFFESRLLTGDRKKRIPLKVIEQVFEYLTEQWFRDDVPEGGKA